MKRKRGKPLRLVVREDGDWLVLVSACTPNLWEVVGERYWDWVGKTLSTWASRWRVPRWEPYISIEELKRLVARGLVEIGGSVRGKARKWLKAQGVLK